MTIPFKYFYLVGSIKLSESELMSLCKEIEKSPLEDDAKLEDEKINVSGKRRKRESSEEYTEERKIPKKRIRKSSRLFKSVI
jgi:hypothetical protein